MANKLHRNRDAIRLLEELLADARAGEVTDVFIVYRQPDGEYGHEHAADNLQEILLQVGTALMNARIEDNRREPSKH